ncbi:unnamed protein product, partial [Rotaria sordida]
MVELVEDRQQEIQDKQAAIQQEFQTLNN